MVFTPKVMKTQLSMAKGIPEDVLNVFPGLVLFQIPSGGFGSSNPTQNCNFNRQRVWNS